MSCSFSKRRCLPFSGLQEPAPSTKIHRNDGRLWIDRPDLNARGKLSTRVERPRWYNEGGPRDGGRGAGWRCVARTAAARVGEGVESVRYCGPSSVGQSEASALVEKRPERVH